MSVETSNDWLDSKGIKQAYKPHIACIGEALIELSGLNFQANSANLNFAGDTMNTAVYLKRCVSSDCEVSYVTALGQDVISEHMVKALEQHNLRTDFIGRREKLLPGIYAIELDDVGERSFRYWRNQSAAKSLFSEGTPTLDDLSVFDTIYFSGISLAILPVSARQALIDKLAVLREGGCLIIFDTNYRPALWESEREAEYWFDRVWSVTDIALPSVEDLEAVYKNVGTDSQFERLAELGTNEILIRRGELAPLMYSKGSSFVGRAYDAKAAELGPADTVVDTTGAGDSFNGAYIAARLRGLNIEKAVFEGHQQALKVIAQSGAIIPFDEG